ncbi:hypothetical protein CEUSTIGMA_g9804.t1 [Chlamydomonas eustigma]|uniref:Uncharacterized protein n=1 Tax=Chlamydomonas eustigma TaxID=1157962 RepID=A0A250XH82_9CHLO|nr:hypothetical protein CEUSTIGMA_g9804.t1 [Chlamydomonas eustigma]|eukprot:GAX82376.1 hypothetical protein CEUSTIGMA_g9804.t1 [Chlamydomonas eustigma]
MIYCDKYNAAFPYPISINSQKRANPNGECHGTIAGHEQNRRRVGRQENAFETAVLLSPTNNVTNPAAQHLQTRQRRSREEFEAGEHEEDVDEQNLQADVDLEAGSSRRSAAIIMAMGLGLDEWMKWPTFLNGSHSKANSGLRRS